ncbi:MAG: hypothetical protein HRS50_01615 [Mycoplasmataceae bacterium]|nr:hypothetical protein [Mycoplasmataceae bacterium]
MATKRQLKLLNIIVGIYVKSGDPVSSGTVLEMDKELGLSSATIRNEMVELEKDKYIIKLDSSSSRTSGRIPTNKGYEHYLTHIKTNPNSLIAIKEKLDNILSDRKESIDIVLDKALELINESTNTLTISKESEVENKLVDIKSYPVKKNKALVIIVTTSGKVINKEINLKEVEYNDFEKVITTYAKRLKNVSMKELPNSLKSLKEIISIQVQGAEDKFQDMIKIIFSQTLPFTKYKGMNNLMSSDTLNIKTQVKTIFKMIENNSIWELINDEGTIKTDSSGITVDMDIIDGVSVVNKLIDLGTGNKQIKILGSKNQDYEKLFSMLEYLEKKIKEK